MPTEATLDTLWNGALASGRRFDAGQLDGRPEPARRYLAHAIAPGTALAAAVRLHMHGQIRLKGWQPFRAEQVIRANGDMLWRASVRLHGLPLSGYDCLLAGAGRMQWKLFGLIPLLRAAGPDITRSAAGRVCAELIWLPSALCDAGLAWRALDPSHAHAGIALAGERSHLSLALGAGGQPERLTLQRWGNPDGAGFGYASFGALIEDEACFAGYTIPTRLRVGWHPNHAGFDGDGEFFRVSVDYAQFR